MYAKSRRIKAFITKFTTVLLDEFPAALDGSIFMRFSVKLIHDLHANTIHSTTKILDNMKAIGYNFGIRD